MHRATPNFWARFRDLPEPVQRVARQNFDLLKANPRHPSLRFRKVGRYWSARIGDNHRVVAIEDGEDFLWFWVGNHDEYIRLIRH